MRTFLTVFLLLVSFGSAFAEPLKISAKASSIHPDEPIKMSAEKDCSFKVQAACTDSSDRGYDTNYSFDLAGIEFKLEGYSQARSSFDYHDELSGNSFSH